MPLPLIYIFHPYIRYIYNYYIVHINACNISSASSPLTSPTIILSGRIRSAVLIRSRILISPVPSTFAFRASSRTRFGIPVICSSALSSMVIIRSSFGIKSDNTFRKVVFPDPVPPLIKMFYFAFTAWISIVGASFPIEPVSIIVSIVILLFGNFLIVTIGPLSATGGSTTFTLDPSSSLASTIGVASLTTL